MKYAEITPIHEKDDKTDKRNHRPRSIVPDLGKIYDHI